MLPSQHTGLQSAPLARQPSHLSGARAKFYQDAENHRAWDGGAETSWARGGGRSAVLMNWRSWRSAGEGPHHGAGPAHVLPQPSPAPRLGTLGMERAAVWPAGGWAGVAVGRGTGGCNRAGEMQPSAGNLQPSASYCPELAGGGSSPRLPFLKLRRRSSSASVKSCSRSRSFALQEVENSLALQSRGLGPRIPEGWRQPGEKHGPQDSQQPAR